MSGTGLEPVCLSYKILWEENFKMSVIFALILVLWVWGRPGIFRSRTGHARWSKIDFLVVGYFDVVRCPLVGGKLEKCFQRGGRFGGLHNFLGFCIAKPVQKPSWTEPRGIGRYGILTVFC